MDRLKERMWDLFSRNSSSSNDTRNQSWIPDMMRDFLSSSRNSNPSNRTRALSNDSENMNSLSFSDSALENKSSKLKVARDSSKDFLRRYGFGPSAHRSRPLPLNK